MSVVRSARVRAIAAIVATYSAAWGLILLNGGRYWDDWTMVKLSVPAAQLMGDMAGQPWQPYLWLTMSWLPGAEYLVHALTFACFLGAALLLHELLRLTPGVSREATVLVPVLFAVFPVNAARIAHIDFPYTLSVVLFYLAWYLVVRDLDKPALARRLVAAVLFAFALVTTNSLLAFIAMPIAHVAWLRRDVLRSTEERNVLLVRYGFLGLLPVAMWLFKNAVFAPWGLYEEYNSMSADSIMLALRMVPASVLESFLKPMLKGAWWLPLAVPAYFLVLKRGGDDEPSPKHDSTLFVAGAAAFFLGVFPYLAVGKLPQATGFGWDLWDSRHQLLVPLGAALMLYGALTILARVAGLKRAAASAAMVALAVGFVVANMGLALDYQADWYKQVSLMRHMEQSEDVRAGNFLVVRDDATALNVVGRRYLPYELSGMMYTVFGDATRFGVDEALMTPYSGQLRAYGEYEQYHWWEYEDPPRGYRVTIAAGTVDVRKPGVVLELMWRQRFDREGFERRLLDIIRVDTVPVDVDGG